MSWATEVAADTPLAWWRLGEASGTTAADSSGNSHPGTLTGTGITYSVTGAIAGDSDKGLSFATSGALSVALNLSALTAVTVEFWLNWTTYADDDRPVVEYTTNGKTTTGGFAITPNGASTPGTGMFEVTIPGGGAAGFVRPLPGEYHHYVVELNRTKHPADGGINCWIDGVKQPRRWCTPGVAAGNFANSTLYAMSRGAASLFATGTLDELAIYGSLLSNARVVAHKVAGQPTHVLDTYVNEVTADTPRVWWRLGETTGTTAADASGNSHPGTWSGTKTLGVTGIIHSDADKAAQVAGAGAVSCAVDLSDLNVLTLEFWWLWPSTPNTDQMVLEYTASGAGTGGFSFSNIGGTAHQWRVVMGGMTVEFGKPGVPLRAPTMDTWHHIVIRLDRAKAMTTAVPTFRHGSYATADLQAVRLYVDSVRFRPTSVLGGGTAVGGNFANSTLYLFSRSASSLFATGTMDEFAIYPSALRVDRIDCHYQAGTGLEWIHPGATQETTLRYKLWNPSQKWDPTALFSGPNIWEDTLPSDAPLHASSAAWVANLKASAQPLGPGGAHSFEYYNGTPPIYIVPPSQRGIPTANGEVVHPEAWGQPWPRMYQLHEEFMAGVPFPDYALYDGSSDSNIVVWRPSTNSYWEMWFSRPERGVEPVASRPYEWWAVGGGHMRDTSISKGYYKDRFASGVKYEDRFDGTTATGLLFSGGVISYDEFNSDSIPHTLHMVVPNANTQYVFPASRGDGQMGSGWIPEGAWVRLDPTYDVDAHFPPASAGGTFVQRKINALCHAIQQYGMLISDKTAVGVGLRFQSTYGAIAEGDNFILEADKTGSVQQLRDTDIMASLPWDNFQVLDPTWVAGRWDELPPAPTAIDTLVDDFSTGSIDSSRWPATIGSVTVVSGQANIRINPTTAGVAILDTGTVLYTLSGTGIFFEAVQMPSDVTASEGGFKLTSTANPDGYSFLEFIFSDGKLIGDYRQATAGNNRIRVAEPAYDPVAHRWLRIRESAGTVYWETSPDGGSWNTFGSLLWSSTGWPAENLNSLRVQFFSDNYNSVPGARAFIVDNINVAGIAPPVPPVLAVTPSSLVFTASEGGTNPAPKTATVTNAGGGSLDVTVSDDAAWLTVTPSSPIVPGTLQIWAAVGGLTAGLYSATVTITAITPGATGSPKTIDVQFTVGPPLVVPPGTEPDSVRVYAMRTRSGDHKTEWVPVDELDL